MIDIMIVSRLVRRQNNETSSTQGHCVVPRWPLEEMAWLRMTKYRVKIGMLAGIVSCVFEWYIRLLHGTHFPPLQYFYSYEVVQTECGFVVLLCLCV